MKLKQPFLKLPVQFDAERLRAEVLALPATAWAPHPTGFVGNEAVRLVTPGGAETDAFEGPMKPTAHLLACPYMMEVMAALGGVWGRSRLMGLGAGAEVPPHVDVHYHWRTHLRIHVPIFTNPGVEFTCGGETVHMAPGECWLFDSFRWHEVQNRSGERRVHLVLDTVVSERLWDLIDLAETGASNIARLPPGTRGHADLAFEQINASSIMSPWEVRCHIAFIAGQTRPHPKRDAALKRLERFAEAWSALWARFGESSLGAAAYLQLIARTRHELSAMGAAEILLDNELELTVVLEQLIFVTAVRVTEQAVGPSSSRRGTQRLAS